MINNEKWQEDIRAIMESSGWICDRDDETTLGFHFIDENGHKWIRDYDKETRQFVHYYYAQKINLVSKKDNNT